MFEKPAYSRRESWISERSVTLGLLIANVIVFALQATILPRLLPQSYLELSVEGMHRRYYWQLLTFQFLHGGLTHLVLNCWALFLFGSNVERAIGWLRFLMLYFLSGISGGLLHIFAATIWPAYFDSPVVGASAGVFGVISAFAILWPDYRLKLLLLFVIPINLRARSLLLLNLLITGLGIAFPKSFLGGNVAHVAHLGGILAGLALARWYESQLPGRV
jgi:uncharacterized protein